MATETLDQPVPQIPASNPYAILGADAQRKKAIADLLLKNSQGPQNQGQMVSGHYIGPGIGGALLPIIQALGANRLNKQANQSQLNLAQQFQGGQSAAVQAIVKQLQSGDRLGAATAAVASPYPALQGLGQKLLSSIPTGKEAGDLVKDNTPESVARYQQTQNPADLVPRQSIKAGEGNQQVIGAGANAQVVTPQQSKVFSPPTLGPGGVPVQQNEITGQAEFGHGRDFVSTSVSQMAPNVAAVEAIKHAYDRLDPAYETALGSQQTYSALDTADKAVSGALTGTATDKRLKLLGALQTIAPDQARAMRLASTAEVQNALTLAAAQTAKSQTGARVSNYEEQVFQKVGGAGTDATTPEIQAAVKIGKAKAANNILQFNQQLDAAGNDPDVKPHLSTYSNIPAINLDSGPYTRNAQTGLYQVDDDKLRSVVGGVQPQPATQPTAQPAAQPAAPAAPAGLQLPPGFTYVGPAP